MVPTTYLSTNGLLFGERNMKTLVRKHKKCKKCGEFSNRWVFCSCCQKFVCIGCAGNDFLCKDHFLITHKSHLVDDYFVEKYEVQAQ